MEMWGVCIYWTQVVSDYSDDLMDGNKYMYVVIPVFVGFVFVFFISKVHALCKLSKFNIKTFKTMFVFAYIVNTCIINSKGL